MTDLIRAYGLLIKGNWFTLSSYISTNLRTEINELPNPSVQLMKATAALKNTERLEIIRFIGWKILVHDRIHGRFLRALLRTPMCSANKLTELELGRDSRQRKVLWLIEVHFSLTQRYYINNYIYVYIYI